MTVSAQHAQADLLGLIRRLPPGFWQGQVAILADDDEHLPRSQDQTSGCRPWMGAFGFFGGLPITRWCPFCGHF